MNSRSGTGFRVTWRLATLVFIGIAVFSLMAYEGVEYYTAQSSFCGGSCHTMTEQYEAWKSNYHHKDNNPDGMQAGCVDCHFLPGEHSSLKADITSPKSAKPLVLTGLEVDFGFHMDGYISTSNKL